MKLLLCCFLITYSVTLSAQKFYVSTGGGIKKVNLTSNGCISSDVTSCSGTNSYSIGLFKDTLYYYNSLKIYKAILSNGSFINCTPIASLPVDINSLTVDAAGNIYVAGDTKLFRIDPYIGSTTFLGDMPYSSAGDLTFFKGELYLAANEGVVKVNINSPSSSTLYIPNSSSSMFGLAVLAVDCNLNKVYGFVASRGGADIVELDIDNQIISPVICKLPFGAVDAASNVETGGFLGIEINNVSSGPQCNLPGKGEVHVQAEPSLTPYIYSMNGETNSSGVFQNLDPGTYPIKITTRGGCLKDTFVNVVPFVEDRPTIRNSLKNADCTELGKISFDIAGTSQYSIKFNSDNYNADHIFKDLQPGIHHFVILDNYQCVKDSFDLEIKQAGNCDTLFFPSAFTPNNDGLNDVFRSTLNFSIKSYEFIIYDRWGKRVFATNKQGEGWKGDFNGKSQPVGVYIWSVNYITANDKKKVLKGTVTLLR